MTISHSSEFPFGFLNQLELTKMRTSVHPFKASVSPGYYKIYTPMYYKEHLLGVFANFIKYSLVFYFFKVKFRDYRAYKNRVLFFEKHYLFSCLIIHLKCYLIPQTFRHHLDHHNSFLIFHISNTASIFYDMFHRFV